jgi:hypothetical protein
LSTAPVVDPRRTSQADQLASNVTKRNGILLCRHHHRAKRRDGWWPTLHDDGTVTWAHADGRSRVDPPPRAIDDEVRTLLRAADDTTNRDIGFAYRNQHTDSDPATASEPPAAYQPRRAPPHAA